MHSIFVVSSVRYNCSNQVLKSVHMHAATQLPICCRCCSDWVPHAAVAAMESFGCCWAAARHTQASFCCCTAHSGNSSTASRTCCTHCSSSSSSSSSSILYQ